VAAAMAEAVSCELLRLSLSSRLVGVLLPSVSVPLYVGACSERLPEEMGLESNLMVRMYGRRYSGCTLLEVPVSEIEFL